MIVSASRRTDIPAFFGDWFMERVHQGFFYRQNPFNPRQVKKISLLPGEVEAIVFWTKEVRPFLKHLSALNDCGFHYYFQYTLNDYPLWLEPLNRLEQRIDSFRQLSERVGPRRVNWRYDPIIFSNHTPVAYHVDRLGRLAEGLGPYTRRLTVSCLDFYAKVERRLQRVGRDRGVVFYDLKQGLEDRDELGRFLVQLATGHQLELVTCAEDWQLPGGMGTGGSCIDGRLIQALHGTPLTLSSDPGQRLQCRCSKAVDMGVYNTCRHLCLYCYAHQGEGAVRRQLARHRGNGPCLVEIPDR